MNWYLKVWKQYADFSGRARRKEFWLFFLFNYIAIFVLTFVSGIFSELLFGEENLFLLFIVGIYLLAALIPSLAVQIRRLHDTGKSGSWFFIVLIPYIGSFILFIFYCMPSDPGRNEWGPNPLDEHISDLIEKFEEL